MKKIKYTYTSGTDIGRRRERNEDRVLVCPEYHFFAVSDGMGGLACGEEAAQMSCDAMVSVAAGVWEIYKETGDYLEAAKQLKHGAEQISNFIYSNGNDALNPIYGATFCGAMILGKHLLVVNIGDSRAYLISKNGKKMKQVTTDHNMAQVALSEGYLTEEEIKKTNLDARLYSFMGVSDDTVADVFVKRLKDGERLLICSDGLYKMLTNDEITGCMKNTADLKKCCERLIDGANQQGGRDNISLVSLKFTAC